MSFGSVENYVGSGQIEVIRNGFDAHVKIFNDSGGALANGLIQLLVIVADADEGLVAEAIDPVTSAVVANRVAVVDNTPLGKASIANQEYGFVKVSGLVSSLVDGTADVALGDYLEVLNAGTGFILDAATGGSVRGITSCAVAAEAVAADVDTIADVFLIGDLHSVSAT